MKQKEKGIFFFKRIVSLCSASNSSAQIISKSFLPKRTTTSSGVTPSSANPLSVAHSLAGTERERESQRVVCVITNECTVQRIDRNYCKLAAPANRKEVTTTALVV